MNTSSHPTTTPRYNTVNVWQDGEFVVVGPAAKMPNRCMVCNAPLERVPKARSLKWIPPEHRGGNSRIGTLYIALVGGALARQVVVRYGRCRKHRKLIGLKSIAMICLFGGISIPLILALLPTPTPPQPLLIGAFVSILVGAILLQFPGRVHIERWDSNCAWLTGFEDAYLDSLPSLREAHDQSVAGAAARMEAIGSGENGLARGDDDSSV